MKVIGVLVIGLGLVMIVIGITGSQSQVLSDIKALNPRLRNAANTGGQSTTSSGQSTGASSTTSSGGNTVVL